VLSYKNAALYCGQLATLLTAGVPLERALTTLSRSAPTRRLRRISAAVQRRITEGRTFAQALGAHAADVPRLMLSFVEVGEQSGRLDEVLATLASYYNSQWDLKRTTFSHLLPMLVYFGLCGALIVFIQFVLRGWDMAWLRRAAANIAFAAACVILIGFAVKFVPAVRAGFAVVGSLIPIVSGIMRQAAISRFALAFQATLGAGFDVRRAIALSAQASAHNLFAARIRRASKWIEGGLTITEALTRTRALDADALAMLEAGELSGRLVETLGHVAVTSRLRATTAARTGLRLFTLLIYVAMLLAVGYVVLQLGLRIYGGVSYKDLLGE
jgi:type II secretory pathway component PulF